MEVHLQLLSMQEPQHKKMDSIKKQFQSKKFKEAELHKSPDALEDYAVKKNVATKEGTLEKVPVNPSDIVNKAYVDNNFLQAEDDGNYITLLFGVIPILRLRKSDNQIEIQAGLDTDTTF